MFTGIITGLGRITDVQALGDDASHGKRLTIATPAGYLADVGLGDSIALNGACMTVTSLDASHTSFTVDISAESLARTAALAATGAVRKIKAMVTTALVTTIVSWKNKAAAKSRSATPSEALFVAACMRVKMSGMRTSPNPVRNIRNAPITRQAPITQII